MFDKVVFAGGGHRCWWQAGFWEQLSGEIELHPRVIGAVSAGAATACLLYANDSKRALAWYERELKGLRSNINWFNLLRPGERLMPHAAIYRKALRALLGGENFRQLMWRAPEIRVQYSRLPPGMSPGRAMLSGVMAYSVEKYWRGSLHPTWGQRMGFTHEVKRVQDCRSERELVDLLVASSCTPPFTPLEMIDGVACIDGGLVDSVPIGTVADVPGQTLVLMTRRYKSLAPVFARNGLIYVQPSRNVAASSWDYTSPAKYHKTYDLGRRDAVDFLKTFALGRYHDPGAHAPGSGAGSEPYDSGDGTAGTVAGSQVTAGEVMSGPVAPGAGAHEAVAGAAVPGTPVTGNAVTGAAVTGATVTGATVTGAAVAGAAVTDSATAASAKTGDFADMRATDERAPGESDEDQEPHAPMSSRDRAVSQARPGDLQADEGAIDVEDDSKGNPGSHPERGAPKFSTRKTDTGAASGGKPAAKPGDENQRERGRLDVTARLADYREPNEAGIAEDLSASQPAESDGQDRSGRSLRASRI